MSDTGLPCPKSGSLFLVSAHHPHVYTLPLQLLHGLAGMGLKLLARFGRKRVSLCKINIFIGYRQRACFVSNQRVNLSQPLQSRCILDENMLVGRLSYANHKGRRRRKAHGTGAGDDQYRNGRHDSLWQDRHSAEQKPQHEGKQGDACNGRNEHEGGLVYDALHRSL